MRRQECGESVMVENVTSTSLTFIPSISHTMKENERWLFPEDFRDE